MVQSQQAFHQFKKMYFMIFKPRQKWRTLDIPAVLNNHDIAQTKEVAFFGCDSR